MENNKFKERQYFDDKLVFILLAGGFIGALYGIVKSLIVGNINLLTLAAYLALILLTVFTFRWLKRMWLKVSVNEKRIKYKLYPFHKKARRISWDEVESCKVIKTPAAAQWHGSNITFTRESSFSLTGRNGLSIKTKDGHCFFIGCKDVDNLLHTLDNIFFQKQTA